MQDQLSFEQRLQRVKEIIDVIEEGQIPLEESVKKFETGIQALNELEKELDDMKRRVTVLVKKPDGTAAEKPLEERI